MESAAIGLLAGHFAAAERLGLEAVPPPATSAIGALLGHITGGARTETFQPMNINFGLFPPIEATDARGRPLRGRERKLAATRRALAVLDAWLGDSP